MNLKKDIKSWFRPAKPISVCQVVITVIMVLAFTFSNILVSRQIAGPFGLIFAGSTFMYPITYILSDLVSEVYGYRWSRFTAVMSLICNLIVVLVAQLVIIAPVPAQIDVPVSAFTTVFQTTGRIFVASALAFFLGDWLNDYVFSKMKRKHSNSTKGFICRALVSSAAGTVIDLLVFYIVAFAGVLSMRNIITLMIADFGTKMLYELLFSPLNSYVTTKINKKENTEV